MKKEFAIREIQYFFEELPSGKSSISRKVSKGPGQAQAGKRLAMANTDQKEEGSLGLEFIQYLAKR